MRKYYCIFILLLATNKLCGAFNLLALTEKILSLGTNTNAFLADLNAGTSPNHLSSHISQLTVGHVEAWATMTAAANVGTAFARDFVLLTKIKNIKDNNSSLAAFNYGTISNFNQFLKSYNNVGCNTCGVPSPGSYPYIFGKLSDILDNTLSEYQKHKNTDNFEGFYGGEAFAKDAINKRDGGQFMPPFFQVYNLKAVLSGL